MSIDPCIALFRTLKKKGWSYAKREKGMWLRKGDYFLQALEDKWVLYYKIGENLNQISEKAYGRRQSQEIARSIQSDQKVRQRCILSTSREDHT